MPLLEVRDLAVRFGGIVALDGVSFDVEAGRVVGLIGPNGAGKTTLFNCLSRLYECDRGEIVFAGTPLLALPRHRERLRLTILLVEHHMGLVMSISDRVVALNFGRVIAQGAPGEVRRHPDLIQAYLGAA